MLKSVLLQPHRDPRRGKASIMYHMGAGSDKLIHNYRITLEVNFTFGFSRRKRIRSDINLTTIKRVFLMIKTIK